MQPTRLQALEMRSPMHRVRAASLRARAELMPQDAYGDRSLKKALRPAWLKLA
jgi:hypothetical protein